AAAKHRFANSIMSANTGTDGEIDLDVEVTGSDDLLSWALKYRAIAVIGYLSLLLAFGKFTVEWWSRSPTLKRIVVPPAVFGGLLGLTCYWMLDSEPDLQNGLHGGLEEIIVNLICFVFTALILGFSSSGNYMMSPRGIVQSIWHEGIPMLLYSQVVLWGQTCVSLVVVCLYQALGTVRCVPCVAPLVTMGLEAGETSCPPEIGGRPVDLGGGGPGGRAGPVPGHRSGGVPHLAAALAGAHGLAGHALPQGPRRAAAPGR
ncbi:unnamed protein product, partial [Heterosigma akashiwo]